MIAIITYDAPHRKTQDLVNRFMMHGYKDMHLIAIPFVERKGYQPIFKHRPSDCAPISVAQLAEHYGLGLTYTPVENIADVLRSNAFKHIVIGGAGLLPADLPLQFQIINSHPGYLPNTKGLDAFKWAIYHGAPIGVTTHYISDKADEGLLIEKRETPIFYEDTFHSVAYRLYETEIAMLVNAVALIENKKAPLTDLGDERFVANKRMSHHLEMIMMDRFEALRKAAPSHRRDD